MGATREQLGSWCRGSGSVECEVLLSHVSHLENLLHTLKLKVFRIETERELHPASTACLQVQLEVLQEQCEVQLRSSQREASRLRDRLHQEREAAMMETTSLQEQLHSLQCTQLNASIAAEELKRVKVQMNQKLQKMKEELKQEGEARLEAEQSHDALLQTLSETETALEKERDQVKALEAECDALRTEVQDLKEDIQEKAGIIQARWQKECEQLRERSGDKDALISKLTSELKSLSLSLQKEKQENQTLIQVGDKVQGLYDESESQCSDLRAALHSLTEENTHLKELLRVEQERVERRLKDQDVQLDIAKEKMLSEVQAVLADRILRQKELETLWRDHTHLQKSSAAALETANTHHNLLEQSIEKLREDLSAAVTERDAIQQEKEENETLRTKLMDKEQEIHTLRRQGEEEQLSSRQEIKRLTELLNDHQTAKHHGRKSAGHEVFQKTLDGALYRSHDLSRANEKLCQRVQDLEELAFNQRARIKAQNILLKQRL